MRQLNDFFYNDLGTVQTVPKLKCATGSAIAALGLAAVGTAASLSVASDNTDTQKELFRESQDFQEKMLLEQERYNSPQNQRAMLEEAGYSPYAFINGASSNVGLASAPSAPSMQMPNLQMFDKMASMLFDMQSMQADVNMKKSQTTGINIQNQMDMAKAQFAEDNALWEMVQNRNLAEKLGFEKESSYWQQKYDAFTFDSKLRQFGLQNDLLRENIHKTAMDSSLVTLNVMEAQKRFEYLPKILDNELKLQLARIDTEYSNQRLNSARYEEAIQGAFLSAAQRNKTHLESVGIDLNNQRLRDTAKYYVDEQRDNALLAKWRQLSGKYDMYRNYDAADEYNWNNRNDVNYNKALRFKHSVKGLKDYIPAVGLFGIGK